MASVSTQDWSVGKTVKAGFLTLVVRASLNTLSRENTYILANQAGTQLYLFTPYAGLERIKADKAQQLIDFAKRERAIQFQQLLQRAATGDALRSKIDQIVGQTSQAQEAVAV